MLRGIGDSIVVATLDLTSMASLESPFYYLQPNDVVYVEPTKRKKKLATVNLNTPRYITIGVSLVALTRRMYQFYIQDQRGRL